MLADYIRAWEGWLFLTIVIDCHTNSTTAPWPSVPGEDFGSVVDAGSCPDRPGRQNERTSTQSRSALSAAANCG
jgi:hypothetical protein